jgi:hypothetical protein
MTLPLVEKAVPPLVEEIEALVCRVRSGSWIEPALRGYDVLGAVEDPLGDLAGWGPAWLVDQVRPLQEALDWLAADPAARLVPGLSQGAAGESFVAQSAGTLVATVRALVRDLVAQFVATVAVRLPRWLAMEGVRLGTTCSAVAAQVAHLVRQYVFDIACLIRALVASLRRLGDILGRLRGLVNEGFM